MSKSFSIFFMSIFLLSWYSIGTLQGVASQPYSPTIYTPRTYHINQAPAPGINNSDICPTCDNTSEELGSQIASVVTTLIGQAWSILTNTELLVAFTIALVTSGLMFALRKKGLI